MSLVEFAPEILSTGWASSDEIDVLNEISSLDELANETNSFDTNWIDPQLQSVLSESDAGQRISDENNLAATLWAQLGDVYLTSSGGVTRYGGPQSVNGGGDDPFGDIEEEETEESLLGADPSGQSLLDYWTAQAHAVISAAAEANTDDGFSTYNDVSALVEDDPVNDGQSDADTSDDAQYTDFLSESGVSYGITDNGVVNIVDMDYVDYDYSDATVQDIGAFESGDEMSAYDEVDFNAAAAAGGGSSPITQGQLNETVNNDLDQYNYQGWSAPTALVQAVICGESNGDPNAVSSAGAIGLGQVTPVALKQVQQAFPGQFDNVTMASLYDPDTNIAVTAAYLSYLYCQNDRNIYNTLYAYEAGNTEDSPAGNTYAKNYSNAFAALVANPNMTIGAVHSIAHAK